MSCLAPWEEYKTTRLLKQEYINSFDEMWITRVVMKWAEGGDIQKLLEDEQASAGRCEDLSSSLEETTKKKIMCEK